MSDKIKKEEEEENENNEEEENENNEEEEEQNENNEEEEEQNEKNNLKENNNNNNENKDLSKQMSPIRKNSEHNISKIEPITTINNQLNEENIQIEKENQNLEKENFDLLSENQKIMEKLQKLKNGVIQIKSRLDLDIIRQLDSKKIKIKEYSKNLEYLNEKITKNENLLKKQNELNNDIELFQNRIQIAYKENSDIEQLLIIQEDEIKNLSLNNTKINEEINDKNFNNENYLRDILSLNNAINESNQTIQKLKLRIQKKIDEEEKRKNIIIEKENEIELLKKFIENLKFQNNNNEQILQNQILKATEENKQLNNLLQNATKQKIDEEDLSNVKPELNDLEEDNLKELAGLMKKVLEE